MMFQTEQRSPLVLASASATRRAMLSNAGLVCAWQDSGVDEGTLKARLQQSGAAPEAAALALATAKAEAVSSGMSGALVIGADQLLVSEGDWFDKPASLAEAEAQLMRLSGQTQRLVTAAVVVQDGAIRWQTVTAPEITLRPFDKAFARRYLAACGDRVLGSVGACQIEHYGAQLIAAIDGDLFSILGLPLLPLLAFLRQEGVVAV
jgi:septum formation protein